MAVTEQFSFGVQDNLGLPTPPPTFPPSSQGAFPPGLDVYRRKAPWLRPESRTVTMGKNRGRALSPSRGLDRGNSHHLL